MSRPGRWFPDVFSSLLIVQLRPEAEAAGFETRIRIYRRNGYFAPEEAEGLIATCRAARVETPARILRSFIARCG